MYAINYMFCSPGVIPKDKIGKSNAMDFMTGEAHGFTEADDPSGTVFFVPSRYYGASAQGYFVASRDAISGKLFSQDFRYHCGAWLSATAACISARMVAGSSCSQSVRCRRRGMTENGPVQCLACASTQSNISNAF